MNNRNETADCACSTPVLGEKGAELKNFVLQVRAAKQVRNVRCLGTGIDVPGYCVVLPDGNAVWLEKSTFENASVEAEIVEGDFFDEACSEGCCGEGMSFAGAISSIRAGKKVARKGWNGKGMYVFLADDVGFHTAAGIATHESDIYVHDMIVMRTVDGSLQPGWLASQADMLADDWEIVK